MTTLQVRDIPDETRLVLKARAARAGQSLSEYVLTLLTAHVSTPTIEELSERIYGTVALPHVHFDTLAALHDARAERERELQGE
ncbi:MAG: hypothetical protein LBM23_02525 [Propionibacteriaceae bacterium]|jgi:plasmid stability protein|nr:hypothetical protein [Propionibacteriaceae bacterium]